MSAPNALPRAVASLVKRLGPDWRHTITHARGVVEVTEFGDARGDGTRPRVAGTRETESVCLRAWHPPSSRAVVAVWVRRVDKPSWAFDMAWRGRHDGEFAPRRLDAGQLAAYASSGSSGEYDLALGELEEKSAARKKARSELLAEVPVPLRWRHVTAGDLIVGKEGAPLRVRQAPAPSNESTACVVTPDSEWSGHVDPNRVAQVLVSAPVADALHLLRNQLGARVIERRSDLGGAA